MRFKLENEGWGVTTFLEETIKEVIEILSKKSKKGTQLLLSNLKQIGHLYNITDESDI